MQNKYRMSLSLNVLNHLGINLYSNIPAVLSEIVANSWDADATAVNITILDDQIIIEDDGCGMDTNDINNKFLHVGHQKRELSNESPIYKRKYMGRKGIGKLSMFSIAKEVEVVSKKQINDNYFEICALKMDIDKITEAINNEKNDPNSAAIYHPEELSVDKSEIRNTGTKIILRNLKKHTSSLTSEYIKKRVSRRFGVIGKEYNFSVFVNGDEVSVLDRDYFHKLSYIWCYGRESEHYSTLCNNIAYNDTRENIINVGDKQYRITGWIGTVESSGDLKDGDENLNKIVIVVRGKLGQEDILSDYLEGGLYTKYLIGEINADFFDEDSLDDMATSKRQEYKKDDERFVALKQFVYNELKHIQNKWTELRNESGEAKAKELLPVIDMWCKSLQGDDKVYAKKMFGKINQIVADDDKKKEILKYSVLAFEKLKYTKHLSAIDAIEAENFEVFKELFLGLDEIEATLYYQIVKERIEIIKVFQNITDENALEKVIQNHLFNHLWLLDPSWERVESTCYVESTVLNALNVEFDGLTPEEKAGRLDLGYRQTAGKHIVIELKRADRIIGTAELVKQVKKYHDALNKVLSSIHGGKNYAFEMLFVVGKPIDNNDSIENREVISQMLSPLNTRVVYYQELIENAYKSYNEYLEANKKSQPLIDMFSQLDTSADE